MITQNFDHAGQLASISGQSSGGTPKTYVNSFGYTVHGAIERMRLGNGRWEHTSFNNRLQPTEIGLGVSPTNSTLLKLEYYYGAEQNNGNVLRQIITVPTIGTDTGFTATQHYQYDQLNRLTGAQEVNGVSTDWQSTMPSSPFWQQMFGYDRFGNRAVVTGSTTSTMIGPNPLINTTNNRITPRSGEYYFFDDAGNMTRGQSNDTFEYDAENKLVRYQGGASQSGGADYSYDGEGRRVKKATLSETLIFVYNVVGQLVAEYTTSTTQNNGTSYLTSDTLGSPRVITKADGSVRARHDYLPFGEELFASAGNRTTGQKYDENWSVTDKTRQKFTQKERDIETGLDYFLARYYSSTQGRFTSPDPMFFQKGMLTDPQRYNLYGYVRNNPLGFIDPKGEAIELTGNDEERKRKLELLRQVVGKEAGAYLYQNKGKDGKYYVGIYANGPDGKGKSFEQINKVTGDVGKIINDKFVAQIEFVRNGTKVEFAGRGAVIGNIQDGGTPGATGVNQYGQAKIFMLDPSQDPGKLPGTLMTNGQATPMTASDVLGHELGHVLFEWGHVTGPTNFVAVDLENQTRKVRDPSAPTRTGHQKANDAVGPQPLHIKIRPGVTLTP